MYPACTTLYNVLLMYYCRCDKRMRMHSWIIVVISYRVRSRAQIREIRGISNTQCMCMVYNVNWVGVGWLWYTKQNGVINSIIYLYL